MATYDLEEQEQLDELKTWWRQHGDRVTIIVTVLALAVAAWQGWNWWQRKQTAQASGIYFVLEQAVGARDAKKSRELAGELIEKYPRTLYAGMGAMLSARAQLDSGDAKTAHVQLQWAIENVKDNAIGDLARLRQATLYLDEKAYDEALKSLAGAAQPAFAPRFAELKGDVLAAQGKKAEAAAAYAAAIAAQDKQSKPEGQTPNSPQTAYREMLQIKLDSQGGAK